jgi:SAM-dependent methyltransferase
MTATCRWCRAALVHSVLDMGEMPLANSLPADAQAAASQTRYPLEAMVCGECFLMQTTHAVPPSEVFVDYPYFSSYSESWLRHARSFAELARDRLRLGLESLVLEIGSNDGYLLRNFVEWGIPALGIEPAANVAEIAVAAGVPTESRFFGVEAAEDVRRRGGADLVIANNVLAHVPDLHDFIDGIARAVKPSGAVSIEVPHLLRLMEGLQFDTIYHEHYSYFSIVTARRALAEYGLTLFDVEELPTHGGSVRLWASQTEAGRSPAPIVDRLMEAEARARLRELDPYVAFRDRVERCRDRFVAFLAGAREAGEGVAAYGAAAKGATLLNYAGVGTSDIAFAADRSPHKHGRVMPGSAVPIVSPDVVESSRLPYLVILPWNLREEIAKQMAGIGAWGGRFVTAVPQTEVWPA